MATPENNDIEVKNDPRDQIPRYSKDIEEDITPARKLLEQYSRVPPDQVIAHIHTVVCSLQHLLVSLPFLRSIPLQVFFPAPTLPSTRHNY